MTVEKCLAAVGAICLLFAATLTAPQAGPDDAKKLGGQVQAEVGGKKIHFPVLKTDIRADVQGDLATVTVVQKFANPTAVPLNALYLFPLNKDAAVFAMQMEVGDERVVAKIEEKQEAEATFEKAKGEGKAAALLTQHRPNMFTQNLANLMPGLPVTITLKYVQTVPRVDDAYELVMPLIVGPRYRPAAAQAPVPPRSAPELGQWELQTLPDYPDVAELTIPDTIDRDRLSIDVRLSSGFDINDVTSATHKVTVAGDDRSKTISLADGRTVGNRDFVLRYRLAGRTIEASVLTHRDERGGFFSLMIEPPEAAAAKDITPRELVFVLDTSGSMYGEPVEASKAFMRHALKMLRLNDSFRIVRFSNNATEFSAGPVPATPQNVSLGLSFVNQLSAGGGTEVPNAIRQAFDVPQTPGTLRIVVFLSDGYIGNEAEVLGLIASRIGKARIYAFGVGTGVNRYLLAEMARMGRGFARFIDPTEKSYEAAIALAHRLETPVLTDIGIDWGTLKPTEVTPTAIPDLFKGDSIRIQGRFAGSGTHKVTIKGLVNGRPAALLAKVRLPDGTSGPESAGIPLVWARTQIADAMRDYTRPHSLRQSELEAEILKRKVTDLGLAYSLTTQWTSFVAVSEKVVNGTPQATRTAAVPLPMVKGITGKAYPRKRTVSFSPPPGQRASRNFGGSPAPEPELIGGLAVLTLAGLASLARRRRQNARRRDVPHAA